MLSLKVRSARAAARLAAGRKLVRKTESGSSSSSTSEKSAVGGGPWGRTKMGKMGGIRYEELEGHRSTRSGCHELDFSLSLAGDAEISSNSDNPPGAGGGET